MSKPFVPKAGTTAECAAFTGLENEVVLDEEKGSLIVHDGVTAGGAHEILPKAKNDELYAPKSGVVTSVNGNTGDITPEQTGCLPFGGGTLTGNVKFSQQSALLYKNTNDGSLTIRGGGNGFAYGSAIIVYGKDHETNSGVFEVVAHDGTNAKTLKGKADGALTWGGNNVITSAGGMFTGKITSSSERVLDSTNANGLFIVAEANVSSTKTGTISVFPVGHSQAKRAGGFQLVASDGTNNKTLTGSYANGLKWDGVDITGKVSQKYSGTLKGTKSSPKTQTITGLTTNKPLIIQAFNNSSSGFGRIYINSGIANTSTNSRKFESKELRTFSVIPTGTSISITVTSDDTSTTDLRVTVYQ